MNPVLKAQAADLNWIPVASSNLRSVAYAADFRRLFVQFKNGGVYAYEDVPEALYMGLLSAPSKGKYLHAVIKRGSQYVYTRVS